jgi:predicted nucleic acid-binding protein
MIVAVADTGPLLHLHQICSVDLLGHFGTIHVTPIVLVELRRNAPGLFSGTAPEWAVWSDPAPATGELGRGWVSAGILDPGEAEGLAYAREINADCFVTDDAAARTLGESFGLQVRGTLGILLYAAAVGRLGRAEAETKLSDLEERSTLWMSGKVKRAARDGLARIFEE